VSWTEEAGFQVRGILKRWVVRVRELLGIDFLKFLNCIYSALRVPVWHVIEARKGSGVAEGLLRREGPHFLGGTCMWGMRDCRLLV
jgi:hypothetical protein